MGAHATRQTGTRDNDGACGSHDALTTRREPFSRSPLTATSRSVRTITWTSATRRRTGAPQSVLEQVMPVLRSAGIVRSERGPAGGYRLNKAPEEITLERVVRLFQGQLAPIGYATRRSPDQAPKFVADSLRVAWSEVRDATIDILERTTFADLAERAGGRWRGRRG